MTPADRPWSGLITTERVVELHGAAMDRYGGRPTLGDVTACVDATLGSAFNAELYLDKPPHSISGLPFAAYLLYYLVKRHCFVDGNKRAAWLAAVDVLAALGLGIKATTDEAEEMMTQVIIGEFGTGEAIAAWLAPRLYAIC